MKWKIPLYKISTDTDDIKNIKKVLRRKMDWAIGPEIPEFEKKIAKYVGSKFCIAFNSGTSAGHAALLAANINSGNIIVPSFTFIATSNWPLMVNSKPKFSDIEEKYLGLDPQKLLHSITKSTKAIIPIHYAGLACNIEEISKISKTKKIPKVDYTDNNLSGKDFQDQDLSYFIFKGANLEGANFENAILKGADLSGANLSGANLSGVILGSASWGGGPCMNNEKHCISYSKQQTGANLSNADLTNVILKGADLFNVNLDGANLTNVDFSEAYLTNVDLSGMNLSNAKFIKSKLYKTDLRGTDLTNSDFSGAYMNEVSLTNSNLKNANLQNTVGWDGCNNPCNMILTNANLSGVDLAHITQTKAIFDVYLRGANLSNANLSGVDFSDKDLSGVDFTNANIIDMNLRDSDLSNVIIDRKITSNSMFSETSLQKFTNQGLDFTIINQDDFKFNKKDLSFSIFTEMDLSGKDLSKSIFKNAFFLNANLKNVNFSIF